MIIIRSVFKTNPSIRYPAIINGTDGMLCNDKTKMLTYLKFLRESGMHHCECTTGAGLCGSFRRAAPFVEHLPNKTKKSIIKSQKKKIK